MKEQVASRWDKDLLFNTPEVCSERARLFTKSYKETKGLPATMRVARAFAQTLSEMTIYIQPNHLIVGNLASKPVASPIWPELGVRWVEKELDGLDKRPYEKFIMREEEKKQLTDVFKYWRGRGREEILINRMSEVLSGKEKEAFDPEAYTIRPVLYGGASKSTGGSGHTALNYQRALNIGFRGIIEEAENALAAIDFSDHDSVKKVMFLKSVIISLKAAIDFAGRYAKLAKELAAKENNPRRKNELQKISDTCNRVPENPSRSYWEALQFIWFMQLLRWIESNGHAVSVGRLDQFLYPYYKKDTEEGGLTREEAIELMENFFVKIYEVKRLRSWPETENKSGYVTFQGITVGGQTMEGHDASNDLSYLILEVTGRMKLPEPVVICRVHSKTPEEFLVKGVESLIRHGGGLPSFFGDEAIIPALLNEGRPLEEARDYAIVPCAAPVVAGRHIDHAGAICYLNLAKVLELALNGGTDPGNGRCLYPQNKDLSNFSCYEEVWEAYKEQLRYWMGFLPIFNKVSAPLYAELNPAPFASALVDYRIQMGMDMTEGGGPIKDVSDLQLNHGVPNVANSLAALKKLVFDEKKISGKELKEALLNNFEGSRGQEIRKLLLKAPKYGNDDDYVDLIAAEVAKTTADEHRRCGTTWRGGSYGPSFEGNTANIPEGAITGATPDGRKKGEPLADNISPEAGTDINGVTAMLRSISKLDHSSCRYGNILNVKFHPTALKGAGVNKLASLIRTYEVDLMGWQIQFNIVSAANLREAQAHPEKYKDLMVKVAGYCAQFISLDKRLQDQIIGRTENVF